MSTEPTDEIRHAIQIGMASIPVTNPLALQIGDEVTALVRLRVTGTSERAPYSTYDKRTVTTSTDVVELVELDEKAIRKPVEAKAGKPAHRALDITGKILVSLGVLFLAVVVLSGCSRKVQYIEPASTPSVSVSVNPTHAALCAQFKAKAEDTTRTDTARKAAQGEYDTRCKDIVG